MEIHAYEKLWFVAALLLIVGFIATITYGSVALGITMVDDQEEVISPGELDEDDRFQDPRVEHVGENEYEAYVVAFQFGYSPNPVEVPANSTVTFYVTSRDVIHSFSLVGTNTNTMVIPGEVSVMTVEFDEQREFGVVCNEYCGAGHHVMEGEVHVVPEDEFETDDTGEEGQETDNSSADTGGDGDA